MKPLTNLAYGVLLSTFAACGIVPMKYTAPEFRGESGARVVPGSRASVHAIDDHNFYLSGPNVLELTPGQHLVKVAFHDPLLGLYSNDVQLAFFLETGHEYTLDAENCYGKAIFSVFDRTAQRMVLGDGSCPAR